MKVKCLHKYIILVFLFFSFCEEVNSQIETLSIDNSFVNKNIEDFMFLYNSSERTILEKAYANSLTYKKDDKKCVFFDLENDYCYLNFSVSNTDTSAINLILEISNTLINEVKFYEKTDEEFKLLNTTGTDYNFSSRLIYDKNYLLPIAIKSKENKTFLIQLKKEKINLVVPGKLWSQKEFQRHSKQQYLLIGLYLGLCIISLLITFYIYTIVRNNVYLIYALYIIFLGLYLFSFLGLYFQYLVPSEQSYNKYIHVFITAIVLLLFVVFSQKILKSKEYVPKFRKAIYILLTSAIVIRFSDFILPDRIFMNIKPFVMRFWFLSFIILNLSLIVLIVKSYKYQKKVTILYSIAFSFINIGTMITVINSNSGYLTAYFFGLPILFYASFLEIIFLTFTIVFMVKEIYTERNELSIKVANQQKRFLTAFIEGEEKERDRIGKELHDNIGSKLSNLKRVVSNKFDNEKINNSVDDICNDVRDLSHKITPSEIKFIGLVAAIKDLIKKYDSIFEINFNSYKLPVNISENYTINLYRIIQESLHNIEKHAKATQVEIQLIGHQDHLTLNVEDNGIGFNSYEKISGVGIRNMQSRTEQLKGTFFIDSTKDKGTSILISIPI